MEPIDTSKVYINTQTLSLKLKADGSIKNRLIRYKKGTNGVYQMTLPDYVYFPSPGHMSSKHFESFSITTQARIQRKLLQDIERLPKPLKPLAEYMIFRIIGKLDKSFIRIKNTLLWKENQMPRTGHLYRQGTPTKILAHLRFQPANLTLRDEDDYATDPNEGFDNVIPVKIIDHLSRTEPLADQLLKDFTPYEILSDEELEPKPETLSL